VSRGYFGIGIFHPKTEHNIGTLWRSAYLYDASFLFTIGRRYRTQSSDTQRTPRHVPLFHFPTVTDLLEHLPWACPLVGIELDQRSVPLETYKHPERACYLLGAEDHGLPPGVVDRCHDVVQISTSRPQSMNVAVAGSLVLHHRHTSRLAVSA
jgi:tRNA G18 (ribose-2'-O)-methylase SpoU